MNILLSKKTRKFPLKNRALLLKVTKSIALFCGLDKLIPANKVELSVILLDDPQIALVNQTYLNHKGATDVISFDYKADYDPKNSFPGEAYPIGDLYISLETAERQGKEYKKSITDELLLYIAHGILHICGYDDHKKSDIKAMRSAEAAVLEKVTQTYGKLDFF